MRERLAGAVWTPLTQRVIVTTVDFVLILAATIMAVTGRNLLPMLVEAKDVDNLVRPLSVAIAIAWLTALALFGSYKARHLGTGTVEYKRVALASMTVAGLLGISAYLAQYPLSRAFFVLLFVIGLPLLLGGRMLLRRVIHLARRLGGLMTPVLVVGGDTHVDDVARVLRRESWLGYQVVGALTTSTLSETGTGVPVLGTVAQVVPVVQELRPGAVIFAAGSFPSSADFRRMAWQLEELKVEMIVVPALTDVSAERLEVRPVAGLPLVHVERPQAMEASRWIKRAFDIVGSAALIVFFAPLMGVLALAIKLEDGGPVIFRQQRVGRRGELFDCLKFRSMVVDAEQRLSTLQQLNEGNGVLFKMAHDPRITRVGRFIRRYSLDEFPQFFNVFRGDMSLVGPRPALQSEVDRYDQDAMRRLHVRPGVTGLWQVSGRSDLSWEDTVRLDLYYVDNWSIIQDLSILAKTAGAVLGSRGAY